MFEKIKMEMCVIYIRSHNIQPMNRWISVVCVRHTHVKNLICLLV